MNPVKPALAVFDISLQYVAYSKKRKCDLIEKAKREAASLVSSATSVRKARALAGERATEIFNGYCTDLHEKFPFKEYQLWLECSIEHERSHLYEDLKFIFEQALSPEE